jgi:LuxR family maltose regulon positive regulatory protein
MTASMLDPSISLKIAPPGVRGARVPQAWLARLFALMRDRAVVMARAPSGYGKTTLLSQWRREVLNGGAFAAWLTLDARDDPARFLYGLVACLRDAMGNPHFGLAALDAGQASGGEQAAMTGLLAGMAEAARPILLILDDAHLLPEATGQEMLTYLLRNLPPNVQLVVGARQSLGLPHGDLLARGEYVEVGADQLRLRVEESIDSLRSRFGERFSVDACARLHELADGWPIALQLLISAIEKDPAVDLASIEGKSGNIDHFFTETLLARLPPDQADVLVTASMLDAIHPALIRVMTGREDAAEVLGKLKAATPVLVAGEGTEWLRMHPLARRALSGPLETIPEDKRREFHWRAALWLHDYGDVEAAVRHAVDAERADAAHEWIGRGLYALAMSGHSAEVLGWAERLPANVLLLPEVRLAVGWAQVQTHAPLTTLAALEAEADPRIRYEADLIHAVVAVYADELDRAGALLDRWGDGMSTANTAMRQVHVNVTSYVLLDRGDSARACYLQSRVSSHGGAGGADVPSTYGELVVGLSHLRDAQPRLVDASLRPAIERAEAAGGRRSTAASMLAAVRGAALWALDRRAEAESVLAYRLDIVERASPPELVALMYVTLARVAQFAGDEPRALELLQRLQAMGEDRRVPRLVLQSLREQIRLQAVAGRVSTATQLGERLEARWADVRPRLSSHQVTRFNLIHQIGRAYARIAAQDMPAASAALNEAQSCAQQVNHTRDLLECRVLLALTAERDSEEAAAMLREALSIAESNGFRRLFADTLPEAIARVRRLTSEKASTGQDVAAAAPAMNATHAEAKTASTGRGRAAALALLTSKEAALLEHLARGLTNKEIARALDVGPETIKWHLKNVFGKLNAGNRRHAVDRARMLGLL